MPVLTRPQGIPAPEQLAGVSTFGEAAQASFQEAWATGPTGSLDIANALSESEEGRQTPIYLGGGQTTTVQSIAPRGLSPKLSQADAQQRVKDAGLEGKIPLDKYPNGIRQETLNSLIQLNTDAQKRQTINSEYNGWTPQLAGMLAGSIVDPSNVALSFIPVVGEARYASLLSKAGTNIFARAGVRAGVGAVEGLTGAALAEPTIYLGQQRWRNDYDAYDSMLNIAGGAVFGGLLHAGAGLPRDINGLPKYNTMSEAGIPLPDNLTPDQAIFQRLNENPDKLFSDYAALKDSEGGTVLNTDVARELSQEYLADRTRSADVHEGASATVKALYADKLSKPTPEGYDNTVMFTAGGTGAGKTTGINALGDVLGKPEIIYDTNMNTLSSAVKKVEQALDAGRKVKIAYVYRDPVDALVNGAIPRAQRQAKEFGTGRTVPLAEHAKTHAGVREVMEALQAKYLGDDRVEIMAIDNSRGRGKQQVVPLESLPRVDKYTLVGNLRSALDEQRTKGLAEDLYRGFAAEGRAESGSAQELGRTDRGEPAQADSFAAVRPFIHDLDQTTQAAALRHGISQALDGRPIDVTPAMLADPNIASDPDAFNEAVTRAMRNSSEVSTANEAASQHAQGKIDETPTNPDLPAQKERLAEDESRLKEVGGESPEFEEDDFKLTTDAVKAATLCMMRTGG